MFWQREVLRDSISMTFNQTYTLELPDAGQLGSLALYVRSAQNAGALTSTFRWRLFEYITKIEVVGDGSEVIKSYEGAHAIAAAFYDDGVEPLGKWGNYSGVTHRQMIPVHFGRKFLDEVYGLDLAKFNTVELKITNDATSTEFSTGITLTVIAYWMREGGVYGSYLREEEWKAYAPVSGAIEYNTLPTRWPIRRIILRARPAVSSVTVNQNVHSIVGQIADIDFTYRGGQTRVYKGGIEELGWLSSSELGRFAETRGEVWRAADDHFDCGIGYVTQITPAAAQVDDPAGVYPGTIVRADTQLSSQLVWDVDGTSPVEYIARGYAFLHMLPLFAARQPDLSDMIDAAALGDVDVNIEAGSITVTGGAQNAETGILLSRLVTP